MYIVALPHFHSPGPSEPRGERGAFKRGYVIFTTFVLLYVAAASIVS